MFDAFSKLLIPVDFSEPSLAALRMGDTIAKAFGSKMHLLHVVERSPYEVYAAEGVLPIDPGLPVVNGQVWDAESIKKAMLGQLEQLAAQSRGGPCTVEVREGNPAAEILASAKSHQCSAIVICTNGRTGLSHLMMGSVAEKVVRASPIPVLTIRAQ